MLCSGNATPIYGATVAVLSGGSPVDSCTTGANGCCQVAIPSSGTYEVKVTYGGTVVHDANQSLTCGGTTGVIVSLSDVVCCNVSGPTYCAIPYNLTLTDANTTMAFNYNASLGYWVNCYTFTPSGSVIVADTHVTGLCGDNYTLGSGAVPITYVGQCTGGGLFTVTQRFPGAWTSIVGGDPAPQDVGICGSFCGFVTGPITFYPVSTAVISCVYSLPTYEGWGASVTAAWSQCGPFVWSGSFPATASCTGATWSNLAPGTVAIS